MGFKCGIVGLPNVGKSTLFNALTKARVAASNYPFCTIDPNIGIVYVPDPRLNALTAIVKPEKVVPTTIEFVDIAGLVAGAAQGEGLGNKFLAHIRETDAIGHVVRCFDDPDVIHVAGKVDPLKDIETINTELMLADLDTIEKALDKLGKKLKAGDKESLAQKNLLERLKNHLDAAKSVRTLKLEGDDAVLLKNMFLLTAKPIVYIANVNEDGFENNPYVDAVKTLAAQENADVVVLCAAIESELVELNDEDRNQFLTELGLQEPGLNQVIRAGYHLLGLLTFFTAGVKEVRAWTIPKGATAPQAAGCIHSDFEKGFIRAEVIAYNDYIKHGGEQGAKQAGKWRLEGKDYIVVDGDVIYFRFNV